LAMII